MVEETPEKVLGLLTAACASLLLLFLVASSNVSFSGAESALPDPFAPQHVVAIIDQAAAGYSQFLAANLINPAQNDYAFVSDQANWVWQSAEPALAQATGLTPLPPPQGEVAGAYITLEPVQTVQQSQGFSIDTLYALLQIR